jgi:hypothetical protein
VKQQQKVTLSWLQLAQTGTLVSRLLLRPLETVQWVKEQRRRYARFNSLVQSKEGNLLLVHDTVHGLGNKTAGMASG